MTKALMTTEDEVWDFLAHGEVAVVVANKYAELFLVFSSGEGDVLAFQGVPQALDERGTKVEANSGRVGDLLAKGPLAAVWPVLS